MVATPVHQVKAAAKAYRVYYTKTNDSGSDYLVDHSIIMYLIDPAGDFVTFYGKNLSAPDIAKSIVQQVKAWQASHPEYKPSADIASSRAVPASI